MPTWKEIQRDYEVWIVDGREYKRAYAPNSSDDEFTALGILSRKRAENPDVSFELVKTVKYTLVETEKQWRGKRPN